MSAPMIVLLVLVLSIVTVLIGRFLGGLDEHPIPADLTEEEVEHINAGLRREGVSERVKPGDVGREIQEFGVYCVEHPDIRLNWKFSVGLDVILVSPCKRCIEEWIDSERDAIQFSDPDPGRWDKESL